MLVCLCGHGPSICVSPKKMTLKGLSLQGDALKPLQRHETLGELPVFGGRRTATRVPDSRSLRPLPH